MARRLDRIITRGGDSGKTGLGDGSRVGKSALRIAALGDIDELNSAIGVLLCEEVPLDLRVVLGGIQNDLFDLGGEISLPGRQLIEEAQVAQLESLVARRNADLPPLEEFILPGGTRAAALAQCCRAICRRAERSLVHLSEAEAVSPVSLCYLNRLSDALFVIGRSLNRVAGKAETCWNHARGGVKT